MSALKPVAGGSVAAYARLAAAILWAEAIAAAFWPIPTAIGAFVAFSLLDLPAILSPAAHISVLIAFGVGILVLSVRGARCFCQPPAYAALRRLERDSGFSHRPFETLADRPADAGDPVSAAMWRLHQDRKRAEIQHPRLNLPHPALPERDPFALRLLVLITLLAGLAIAGTRTGGLIIAALSPHLPGSTTHSPVDAWIRPPAYTGVAPILLHADVDGTIQVPTGSTIEAHVTGESRTPRLVIGDSREDFHPVAGGGFAMSRVLNASGALAIRRGWSTLAQWRIAIIPDRSPTVEFANPPADAQSGALRIEYHATDDYGVATIDLNIRALPGHRQIVADPIALNLADHQSDKEIRGVAFEDLTAHPWAGTQVLAKLIATDGAGQSGESDEVVLTLPERVFTNPVAQTIVAARKHFIQESAPRGEIVRELSAVTARLEASQGDFGIFLALRSAIDALNLPPPDDPDRVADIEDLLWNAALQLEDGDRPEADKALRAAEDALEKALKDPNTPASEIARLTQNLKDAMNRDIQAMLQKLREQQARGEAPPSPPNKNAQVVDRRELEKALDKMAQLAEQGSRAAAQEMLAEIKNMLANMQAGMESNKANQQGMQALEDLKALAQKQRGLEQSNDPNAAQSQEALRKSLGDAASKIGEAMGKIPKSLGSADKAMSDAAHALQRGKTGDAKSAQEDAASQLDEAIQSLSDQMSEQGMNEQQGEGEGRDPFGRGRFDRRSDVKVPTDREMQRSREILDELRKRAGEHDRSRMELDYLRRLLQQF
jgi:uncharacterized protein (TIGR02302 family)